MRKTDILKMAVHNLLQRKARTLLNLVGIVVGCIVLLMTSAGVQGVKDALQVLFDSSEIARQIGVLPDRNPPGEAPPEAIAVTAEMSVERRERITQQLENIWNRENRGEQRWQLDSAGLQQLHELKNVTSVVPDTLVSCQVSMVGTENEVEGGPPLSSAIAGIDVKSQLIHDRLLAGKPLPSRAADETLIDEFLAYQLGFKSDADLERIVGKQIRVRYKIVPAQSTAVISGMLEKLGQRSLGELVEQAKLLAAAKKLVSQLDESNLTSEEKKLLRNLVKPTPQGKQREKSSGERHLRVTGVVRQDSGSGLTQLFRGHWFGRGGGVYVHTDLARELYAESLHREQYNTGIVTVDSTANLEKVTEELESIGLRTLSAMRIIQRMESSVDESAWVVFGVAAAILLTAGIGISNTLLISVLERTPEFGIMKSVGARNSTLLWLMMCEGGILGLLGAAIATAVSLVLAKFGQQFLEMYLEYRLGGDIAASLFQFTPAAIALVTLISVAICVIASIIPAWRAARLDPVVAMRRS